MSDLRRAAALMDGKQHAAALPILRAVLRRNEQKPDGPPSADMANILHNIGQCYFALCDFRAAADHYRRAAAISDYGFKNRFLASLDTMSALVNLSDYVEVERQNNASLSLIAAEVAAGTTAPALLKGHRMEISYLYATSLTSAGRFSEALPLYEEIVAYYESIGDTEILTLSLTGLGIVYFEQGLPEKALAMARRAQSLNPSSVASLEKLCALLFQLNRHDEELICVRKALECEAMECGKTTPNFAALQGRMGAAYIGLGQFDVALSWYHRARTAYEKLNLAGTPKFGMLLVNMGVAYAQSNNLTEALAHYTRAEAIYRGALLPPDHPSITKCMLNISIVNAKLGNIDAAAAAAAAVASTSRRSQVQCAGPDCPRKIKADGTPLDQCGGCKRCYYCSKACQTAHWKAGHKAECVALRVGK